MVCLRGLLDFGIRLLAVGQISVEWHCRGHLQSESALLDVTSSFIHSLMLACVQLRLAFMYQSDPPPAPYSAIRLDPSTHPKPYLKYTDLHPHLNHSCSPRFGSSYFELKVLQCIQSAMHVKVAGGSNVRPVCRMQSWY